jgi:hypothetical protein
LAYFYCNTIKAVWKINEYEVSFDLGYDGYDEAFTIATQKVKYEYTAHAVTNPNLIVRPVRCF